MDALSDIGVAWVYSLGLLVLGFGLFLLEIFLIPGLNIFGFFGLLSVLTGIYIAYLKLGFEIAFIVAGLAVVVTTLLLRKIMHMRTWRRLVLDSSTSRADGFNSINSDLSGLVGVQAEAVTPLRPAGRIRVNDEIYDVVSEGCFVEPGVRVQVIEVEGRRIVVQPVDLQD